MRKINEIDENILSILRKRATTPKAEIGRKVGLAPSAVSERIKRLEEDGAIIGYEARVDHKKLGLGVLAFISVSEHKPTGDINTGEALALVTGVEEVYKVAGKDCFLVKIRAHDTEKLNEILDREINPIASISGTSTTIVLKAIKEGAPLNLGD